MRKLVIATAAAALVGSAACASMGLGGFAEPVVTVSDVRVNGLGLTGGSVDIKLNVYNPNNFRLDGTQLTYQLWVDTIPFGNGTTNEQFVVNAGDSTIVTLPLDFTWSGVGTVGRSVMNTGTVPYRVAGNIRVSSAVGGLTVPYDRSGRFSPLGGSSR
jgi:LEA14-like dessication related protein